MTQEDRSRESRSTGALTPRPRPRRALNTIDWLVRVPIGLVWLVVLTIAAVPIFIYMTLLYWIVRCASSLFGRRRAQRGERSERQERVA